MKDKNQKYSVVEYMGRNRFTRIDICKDFHINKLSLSEIREKYGFNYFWEIRSVISQSMKDNDIKVIIFPHSFDDSGCVYDYNLKSYEGALGGKTESYFKGEEDIPNNSELGKMFEYQILDKDYYEKLKSKRYA